jgi:hypothetical protein
MEKPEPAVLDMYEIESIRPNSRERRALEKVAPRQFEDPVCQRLPLAGNDLR